MLEVRMDHAVNSTIVVLVVDMETPAVDVALTV